MRRSVVTRCATRRSAGSGARRALGCLMVAVGVASFGGCASDDVGVASGPAPETSELVACGTGGPTFPRSALDAVRDAPAADSDMVEGLRTFLESEEGPFWPQDGWRVLTTDDRQTTLFTEADSQLWFQSLERRDGAWQWAGSSATGACPLRIPAPAGFNEVIWRLDPDGATPTPTSTRIDVLVHESACANGEPVGDRLVGPEVEVTETEVRIGFLAEAQAGDFSCPGNPDTPVTIELDTPLGDRTLVDAYDLGSDLRDHL